MRYIKTDEIVHFNIFSLLQKKTELNKVAKTEARERKSNWDGEEEAHWTVCVLRPE